MSFSDILKTILFGVVEGYTEFLPISSTGHLILVEELVHLSQPEDFFNVFKVVIQLGAIMSVVILYWDRLWPFGKDNCREIIELWLKIAVACIPAVILGLPLNDIIDEKLSTPLVIAIALIVYGIAFLVLEKKHKDKEYPIKTVNDISWKTAFFIGILQCLALIPGTSRSGACIFSAMLLGVSRAAAAEFSFFLGIPMMFGATFLKIIKNGISYTGEQWAILILGTVVSFIVAFISIRSLMNYIRKHDFTVFGWYRIVLGAVILIYFVIAG